MHFSSEIIHIASILFFLSFHYGASAMSAVRIRHFLRQQLQRRVQRPLVRFVNEGDASQWRPIQRNHPFAGIHRLNPATFRKEGAGILDQAFGERDLIQFLGRSGGRGMAGGQAAERLPQPGQESGRGVVSLERPPTGDSRCSHFFPGAIQSTMQARNKQQPG